MIFISDGAEKFEGGRAFKIFVSGEKLIYFTFYGGQYVNIVKSRCLTEKPCIIVSLGT